MKIIIIIQARMSSERLPGKVLKEINGIPMIKCIAERASLAKRAEKVIVATSNEESDDILYGYCKKEGICVFRGELNNVLKRYYDCAVQEGADIIIRLTGDNALVDADIIDRAAEIFVKEKEWDYLHYCRELPLGMAVEIFSYDALKRAYENSDDEECREHVTLYMYKNPDRFKCTFYSDTKMTDNSYLRWTTDTEEDYRLVNSIYHWFGNQEFHYKDILAAYEKNPGWFGINSEIRQKKVSYKAECDKLQEKQVAI